MAAPISPRRRTLILRNDGSAGRKALAISDVAAHDSFSLE